MRHFFVLLHRYAGLVMIPFLTITALTGCLLAWNDELERVFAPDLFVLPAVLRGNIPLDLLTLRERVAANFPQARIDGVDFTRRADEPARFSLAPRSDAAKLPFDEVAVDPASGNLLGARMSGDIRQGTVNLMPFIYRLHEELALGHPGTIILGGIALLWSVDCLVGAYLTVPAKANEPRSAGTWLRRWQRAWRIRRRTNRWKLTFDLHRAGGLWPWVVLLILAWSSVGFNLPEVYRPVMATVFGVGPPQRSLPVVSENALLPRLDWRAAYSAAKTAMERAAVQHHFTIRSERLLYYDPVGRAYAYRILSDRDVGRLGNTQIFIDASTGEEIGIDLPTGRSAYETVTTWLGNLHTASVLHSGMRIVITVVGIAILMLNGTGLIIYFRKRAATSRQPAFARRGAS